MSAKLNWIHNPEVHYYYYSDVCSSVGYFCNSINSYHHTVSLTSCVGETPQDTKKQSPRATEL